MSMVSALGRILRQAERCQLKPLLLTLTCGRARISLSSSSSPISDSSSGEFWSNSRSTSATSRHFCTASLGGARVGLTTLLEMRSYNCWHTTQKNSSYCQVIHTSTAELILVQISHTFLQLQLLWFVLKQHTGLLEDTLSARDCNVQFVLEKTPDCIPAVFTDTEQYRREKWTA